MPGPSRIPATLKPPRELIDELEATFDAIDEIVVEEPPPTPAPIVPPTAIQVETRLCSSCGRHPAVPYRPKCQECCITDAVKRSPGGLL